MKMKRSTNIQLSACLLATILCGGDGALAGIQLTPTGVFQTGIFEEGGSEIVAYDATTFRVYSITAVSATVNVLDVQNPANPTLVGVIPVLNYVPQGGGLQSVAVHDGLIAVAARPTDRTKPGTVAFFNSNLQYVNRVKVGALPDMVIFSPDGRWVLTADEGEPSDDYKKDPHGTVSIIDMSVGAANLQAARDVRKANFDSFNNAALDPSIRIFGPNAKVNKDLEPEYITVSADSRTAWVTLQENNAIAVIDIPSATVIGLAGLGFKDHSLPGNGLDASDRDNAINIRNWPIFGMYQPDAIASYVAGGNTYLVMANEGDARDYDGFSEEVRLGSADYVLDPVRFPNATDLKKNANLGRLRVTNATGDTDGDGDFDEIYAYGARSFSIRDVLGNLIFDSGDDFEQITAFMFPLHFNAGNNNNNLEDRSDDKGPEPEGVVVGVIDGRTYAFIGLERVGGIMMYDVTDPFAVLFVDYVNNRNFNAIPGTPAAGDLGPEGLAFVSATESPTGVPLLVVGNEVSGTTTIYTINSTP